MIISNQPYSATVAPSSSGTGFTTSYAYNPGYSGSSLPQSNSGYYIAQPGDTWASVAAQYGIDGNTLQAVNTFYLNANDTSFAAGIGLRTDILLPGDLVSVPAGGVSVGLPGVAALNVIQSGQQAVYMADSDRWFVTDTPLSGAGSQSVRVLNGNLDYASGLQNAPYTSQITNVSAGTPTLFQTYGSVSFGSSGGTAIFDNPGYYTVQPGDTAASIAQITGEDSSTLANINPEAANLQVGQQLREAGTFFNALSQPNDSNGQPEANFTGNFTYATVYQNGVSTPGNLVFNMDTFKEALVGSLPGGSDLNQAFIVDGNGDFLGVAPSNTPYTIANDTPGSTNETFTIDGVSFTPLSNERQHVHHGKRQWCNH